MGGGNAAAAEEEEAGAVFFLGGGVSSPRLPSLRSHMTLIVLAGGDDISFKMHDPWSPGGPCGNGRREPLPSWQLGRVTTDANWP